MEKTMMKRLLAIQTALKAPKGQYNSHGKYKYRSCEDILESVKPLLKDAGLVLRIEDDIVEKGHRFYVRATVTLLCYESGESMSVSAFAREQEELKGMIAAQITGAASSYARKYALNGLFLIDDTKDADAINDHGQADRQPQKQQKPQRCNADRNEAVTRLYAALGTYADRSGADIETLKKGVKKRPDYEDTAEFYNRVASEFEAA